MSTLQKTRLLISVAVSSVVFFSVLNGAVYAVPAFDIDDGVLVKPAVEKAIEVRAGRKIGNEGQPHRPRTELMQTREANGHD